MKTVENFMSDYVYTSNNIDFRICSSSALSKYKETQSFSLNELQNGRFPFSSCSKEILLLKYDMWFKWLLKVESYIIINTESTENVTKKSVKKFTDFCNEVNVIYTTTMKDHTNDFKPDFTNIWLDVHQHVYSYLITEIKDITKSGISYANYFKQLVDILIEVMEYTLYELVEIEHLLCKFGINECQQSNKYFTINVHENDPFFIIYSNLNTKFRKKFKQCLMMLRLSIYRTYFEINNIYLKNYSDTSIAEECFNNIEQTCDINYKLSLTQHKL